MARFSFTDVVAVSTSTKTLLQLLAATNHTVKIQRIMISGNSNDPTETPVRFDVLRQTSAGTSSAAAGSKLDSGGDTLDVTAVKTVTSEPSDSGDVILSRHVHPISGAEIVFPPGREIVIKAAERVGVRVVTPAQGNTWAITIEGEE
jgi:hypothetical protein